MFSAMVLGLLQTYGRLFHVAKQNIPTWHPRTLKDHFREPCVWVATNIELPSVQLVCLCAQTYL